MSVPQQNGFSNGWLLWHIQVLCIHPVYGPKIHHVTISRTVVRTGAKVNTPARAAAHDGQLDEATEIRSIPLSASTRLDDMMAANKVQDLQHDVDAKSTSGRQLREGDQDSGSARQKRQMFPDNEIQWSAVDSGRMLTPSGLRDVRSYRYSNRNKLD